MVRYPPALVCNTSDTQLNDLPTDRILIGILYNNSTMNGCTQRLMYIFSTNSIRGNDVEFCDLKWGGAIIIMTFALILLPCTHSDLDDNGNSQNGGISNTQWYRNKSALHPKSAHGHPKNTRPHKLSHIFIFPIFCFVFEATFSSLPLRQILLISAVVGVVVVALIICYLVLPRIHLHSGHNSGKTALTRTHTNTRGFRARSRRLYRGEVKQPTHMAYEWHLISAGVYHLHNTAARWHHKLRIAAESQNIAVLGKIILSELLLRWLIWTPRQQPVFIHTFNPKFIFYLDIYAFTNSLAHKHLFQVRFTFSENLKKHLRVSLVTSVFPPYPTQTRYRLEFRRQLVSRVVHKLTCCFLLLSSFA